MQPDSTTTVTELWLLSHAHCRIPLEVQWVGQDWMARVRIAEMRMPEAWKEPANDLLFESSEFMDHDKWLTLTHDSLCGVAARVEEWTETTDPESWLEWIRPRFNPPEERVLNASERKGKVQGIKRNLKLRAEFFGFLAHHMSMPFLRTPQQAELLWHILCAKMLDWLVNKQQPIDLIFCKLVPTMLRRNFEQRVAITERAAPLHKRLLHPNNRAYSKNNRCLLWRLEVLPETPWWKSVLRAEKTRRILLNDDGYFEYSNATHRRCVGDGLRIVAATKMQERAPHSVVGLRRMDFYHRNGTRRGPQSYHLWRERMAAGLKPYPWKKPFVRKKKPVVPPDAVVPAVCPLQPEGQDVRDPRGLGVGPEAGSP